MYFVWWVPSLLPLVRDGANILSLAAASVLHLSFIKFIAVHALVAGLAVVPLVHHLERPFREMAYVAATFIVLYVNYWSWFGSDFVDSITFTALAVLVYGIVLLLTQRRARRTTTRPAGRAMSRRRGRIGWIAHGRDPKQSRIFRGNIRDHHQQYQS